MRIILTLTLFLAACGGSDPVPPTGSQCETDQDIAQNCYTCASTPVCGWCASSDDEQRGCVDRADPNASCDSEVVRISDLCNDLDEGLDQ